MWLQEIEISASNASNDGIHGIVLLHLLQMLNPGRKSKKLAYVVRTVLEDTRG